MRTFMIVISVLSLLFWAQTSNEAKILMKMELMFIFIMTRKAQKQKKEIS